MWHGKKLQWKLNYPNIESLDLKKKTVIYTLWLAHNYELWATIQCLNILHFVVI